jgi:hypothetical protein
LTPQKRGSNISFEFDQIETGFAVSRHARAPE